MGSSCSLGGPAPLNVIEKPQSSVNSVNGKQKRSSHFIASSSSDSDDELSESEDSSRSGTASNIPSPQEIPEERLKTPTPQPPPRPTPVQPKIPWLSELPKQFRDMMCGRLTSNIDLEDKIIYIYHCANFADSLKERSALHLKVYPKLREHCAQNGCELHVVDFLWGLRDEFVQGHKLRGFAEQYLRRLCERDRDVVFTAFLSEKYGNCWCPLQIDEDSVAAILKKVTEDDKHFFLSWYQLDENLSPPLYVLQPVEWKVPRYGDNGKETYKEGYREWEKELIRLRNVLVQATGPEFHQKYCISAIEREIEGAVFTDKINRDNIFWIRRSFTKLNMESGNPVLGYYLDLHRDHLDENAQNKLKSLGSRLVQRIDPEHKVDVTLDWDDRAMATLSFEPTAYFDELCAKYEKKLQGIIDQIIEKKQVHDKLKTKLTHRGISRLLQADLIHNIHWCQKLTRAVTGFDHLLERLEAYLRCGQLVEDEEVKAGVVKPVCIHGSVGSGKSTLAASLAKNSCSVEGWTSSVCVMRFIGASTECETLNQVLISLCEQITLLSQRKPHEDVYTKPILSVLSSILCQVPQKNPLLVILDGLDNLNIDLDNLSWLPRQLPSHVRMVITVTSGSSIHNALKNQLNEASFLEIQSLSYETAEALIWNELKREGHLITELQMDQVMTSLEGNTIPMTAVMNASNAVNWTSFTKIHESSIGNDIKCMAENILIELEKKNGKKIVERAMMYLAVSRYGLSDPEMIDLLSMNEGCVSDVYQLHVPLLKRIPVFYWCVIKDRLRVLLKERTHSGILVTSIGCKQLKDVITERYARELQHARHELLEYFDGRSSSSDKFNMSTKQSKNGTSGRKVRVKSQPIKWDNAYNGRKLGELPLLLTHHEKDLLRLMVDSLFNWEWLNARLHSSNPWQLALDLDVCHKELLSGDNEVNLKELVFLEHWLDKLSWILCMDPSQFGPQIFMNIHSGKLVLDDSLPMSKKLYEVALESLPTFLIPSDGDIFGLSDHTQTLTNLHLVKGDDNHVISQATKTGEVKIWNLHSGKIVRTLTGINEPKDLKMLDYNKVVMLCNRELTLYDLDAGEKLLTLKGVLNINMPFFGIHDKDHTIAMARNRMYVNMMSNNTGEMVTTFKVGEDRFLNSLLVSEQGNICVCGDAVQKPFPLLVWNLHERKLVYDLRITGHEFLTKMAAITAGGEYVVVACREIEDPDPNFIMVYDLQTGSVFRKWKYDFSATSISVSSKTSLVVSAHEDASVVVWDLIGGSQKFVLKGPSRGADVIRLSQSGTHAMTYDSTGLDTTVWYWHIVDGLALGCFCTEAGVSCGAISNDGLLVVIGIHGADRIITLRCPGYAPPMSIGVFGDASRMGKTFDMSTGGRSQ